MPETRLTDPHELPEDDYDQSLRPRSLSEFVGQESIKEPLSIFIEAAKRRGEALDHVLLSGPPGLGKTTLAHILSHELEVKLQSTSGPALERPGDLAGVLTSQGKGDLLFVDEIHRLSTLVEEYLYPAMEDYRLDIVIDSGPAARTVKLELAQFTLVGATTRAGLLSSPLRSRFGVILRLNYYPAEDLAKIIRRSAGLLKVEIDGEGVTELARRSRGTPRVANRLLRRVRDYAEVRAEGKITGAVADAALKMLMIDGAGLDEMDRRMLTVLCENFGGGPTGVKTIAVAVGEEPDTIEEVHEPFLIQQGFLQRTPQGRMATLRAWEHLGLNQPQVGQRKLKF